jgi:hypothetical protein
VDHVKVCGGGKNCCEKVGASYINRLNPSASGLCFPTTARAAACRRDTMKRSRLLPSVRTPHTTALSRRAPLPLFCPRFMFFFFWGKKIQLYFFQLVTLNAVLPSPLFLRRR